MRITYVNMALTWSRTMTSHNNTPQVEKGIPLGFLHRIYISGEIGSPENYIETFELGHYLDYLRSHKARPSKTC